MHRFLLIISAMTMAACETIVDLDVPKDPPRLVINGFLSPDSVITVHLSESRYILDQEPFTSLSGAQIELFEEGMSKGFLTEHNNDGWYQMNRKPGPSKVYKIIVDSPSHGQSEATAYVPSKIEILDARIDDRIIVREGDEVIEVNLTFKDPVDQDNFYEIRLLADEFTESYMNHAPVEQYDYYQALNIRFADPALQEENGSSGSLLFNDLTFNGKEVTLRIFVAAWQVKNLSRREEIYYENADVYRTVTQDSLKALLSHIEEPCYLFKRSAGSQWQNDGNPFAEPVTVQGNVVNGYGIFTGTHHDLYDVDIEQLLAGEEE